MLKIINYINDKASTTSVIAIFWTLAAIGFLFYIASGAAHAHETIQTQCIQGLFGIVMLIAGYYFGSSKKEGVNVADNDQVNIKP